MRKAWLTLAAVSFAAAMATSGCVITSGDDDDDISGGSGGTSGSSGSGGSTAGTGGSAAGAGGGTSGTGGVSGTGGSSGAPYTCENVAPNDGTPFDSCAPTDPNNPNECELCVEANCCTEYKACFATNPDNSCGWGGPPEGGVYPSEILCMISSIQEGASPEVAAGNCASPGCGPISSKTSELFACMDQNCITQCEIFPLN